MTKTTIGESIGHGVKTFFEPLVSATADTPEGRKQLDVIFTTIGVDINEGNIETIQGELEAFVEAYNAFVELLGNGSGVNETFQAFASLLSEAESVFNSLEGLSDVLSDVDGEDVVPRLLEYLAVVYVQKEHTNAYYVAVLLTVISIETDDDYTQSELDFLPYTAATEGKASLDLEKLGELLDSPIETLRDTYVPDGPVSESTLRELEAQIIPWLAVAAGEIGFKIAISDKPAELAEPYARDDVTLSRTISVRYKPSASTVLSATIALAATSDGLALFITSRGGTSADAELGDWQFVFDLTGDTAPSLFSPDGRDVLDPDGAASLTGTTSIQKQPDPETGSSFVLGPADSTRLELRNVGIEGSVAASETEVEADVVGHARDSSFVLEPDDGDGFIQHVLPEDGVGVDFDAGLGWGTERGLYFEGGGAGLASEIPVNLDVADVLSVDTLHLAAQPEPSDGSVTIPVHVAADPQVTLGPIDATVRRIGLEAELSFPEDNSGNLGPVAVDLGSRPPMDFKPPTGAGLSVDAGVVTGGGYLEFDPENQRYAGVLQLHVGELTLTAVGLLTTQLPGGRDGFSLLLIISGEFPPIQLGFGFTLEGVGGLLGINRTMDVDYLVAGVSDGTVRSIMFPDDPVRNAPQIISDLRNGFPVAAGNHVFGPMGKLGWGTPTMLSASIGVLLELPDPIRIAILGRVHAGLPHEEVGIVVLNMDVLGAVDFGEQVAQAAASLYDSRIQAYTLTGDMAMKTGWGDDPDFALSVGGFNPRFEPPPEFPELRRIALTLGPGNPRIRWEGYFAVTTNTVQVGAGVEVYAAAADFSFEGKMGFDTLFRFDPFELIADFYAGFALKRGGSQLMSVDLDGTLKGPGPWHVTGEASFEIWPVSFDVSVDQQFGEEAAADELSPADVFGQVVAALGDERNWSAQRPANGVSAVRLRQVEAGDGQVLAHPLGRLAVRQQISPLGVSIETYGNGSPATYDHFEIATIEWGDLGNDADEENRWQETDPEQTREKFARGEYFELSDDEKLEGPPFESYAAGCELSAPGFDFGGKNDESVMTAGTLEYETAVIDEEASLDPIAVGQIAMPQSTADSLAAVSAVARGPLRTTGEARYEVDDEDTGPTGIEGNVSVSEVQFVVARTEDMSRAGLDAIPHEGTTWREATEALEAYLEDTDGNPDDYQVVGVHEVADGEDGQ